MVDTSSTLMSRYLRFMDVANDPSIPPPRVFEPLSSKQLNEIKLIREVSAVLQKNKDDEELKKTENIENEAEAENKKEDNKKNAADNKTES